jgi:hypothetical protein
MGRAAGAEEKSSAKLQASKGKFCFCRDADAQREKLNQRPKKTRED